MIYKSRFWIIDWFCDPGSHMLIITKDIIIYLLACVGVLIKSYLLKQIIFRVLIKLQYDALTANSRIKHLTRFLNESLENESFRPVQMIQ